MTEEAMWLYSYPDYTGQIMFLLSNKSVTIWLTVDKDVMLLLRKCILGKGTRFTHIFLRSALSWPGNLKEQVIALMSLEIRLLISLKVGDTFLFFLRHILVKQLLSITIDISAFYTKWWHDSTALYGYTIAPDTFYDGKTLKVDIILFEYSCQRLSIKSAPRPEPVPPDKEWVNWNPCSKSQHYDYLRIFYIIILDSYAPYM